MNLHFITICEGSNTKKNEKLSFNVSKAPFSLIILQKSFVIRGFFRKKIQKTQKKCRILGSL